MEFRYECPECRCDSFYMLGSRLGTIVTVKCFDCSETVAEMDQQDFVE